MRRALGLPALLTVPALAVLAPAPAAAQAAPPECPPSVAGLPFAGGGPVELDEYGLDGIACQYANETRDRSANFNVTWIVERRTPQALVGTGPCQEQTVEENPDYVSVASPTREVTSTLSTDPGPPPAEGRELLERLVRQAEPFAVPCEGDAAPGPEDGETPAAAGPVAGSDTGGGDDSPSDEAMLIAIGLIMMLLGIGPGLLSLFGIGTTPQLPPEPTPPPGPVPVSTQILDAEFGHAVKEKQSEGYWVRNPSALGKAWSSIRYPWWGDKSGQCGEFAQWGVEWTKETLGRSLGPGAVVDFVFVSEQSSLAPAGALDTLDAWWEANHAATRVILPSGERYVVDWWEYMGRSAGETPRLVPEAEWAARWKGEVGEGVLVRSSDEMTLKNFVGTMGDERGFEALRTVVKDPARADTIIRSWQREPW